MAKKIKNPIFAHGTRAAIQSLIESGDIKYPAYLWYTDDNTYNFLDKSGKIEKADFPKLTGTLENQIILADLNDGIYYVKGQYKVTEKAETVHLAASYVIVLIGDNGNKVRRITADDFEDYTIKDGEIIDTSHLLTESYLVEHKYATEGYVNAKVAAMEASLKSDLTEYFGYALPGMVSAEIDKQIKGIPQSDIRKIFGQDTPVEDLDDLDDDF